MIGLGILAIIWQQGPRKALDAAAPAGWIEIHILVSVATYGLVTIAAVASLAAFLQERALKTKRPTNLTHMLPSVADCESMVVRLLILSEIVLALGVASGMATLYGTSGAVIKFDRSTMESAGSVVYLSGHWAKEGS